MVHGRGVEPLRLAAAEPKAENAVSNNIEVLANSQSVIVHSAVHDTSGHPAAASLPLFGPPDEATLKAAVDRLTAALTTATDGAIPALVTERAALRDELRALREAGSNVLRLDATRARKEPGR